MGLGFLLEGKLDLTLSKKKTRNEIYLPKCVTH